ncbi:S41 family peptidase [Bacteroidota bacterium]
MKHYLLILIVFTLCLFYTCESILIEDNHNDNNLLDFQETWEIVDSIYPFFELKKINWDSLYYIYRDKAIEAKGDEIFEVLYNLLNELKDGHVRIGTQGGEYIHTFIPERTIKDRGTFNPVVTRNYFSSELKVDKNKKLEYEITNSNVGYIRIATFYKSGWTEIDMYNAIKYMINTKGLIIDVRNNIGGSYILVNMIVKRLINEPVLDLPVRKNDKWFPRNFINPSDDIQYNNPVIILVNGVCYSATEQFIAIIEQAKHVILIGDTTGGGSSAPKKFTLTSGKEIYTSTHEICRSDSVAIEFNGIVPDIRIVNTLNEIENNIDRQLEFAINYLNKN